MTADRRQQRSHRRLEALRLYVEALAARYQLHALAIASHEGFLLAGAGAGYDLEQLAVLGAIGADRPERVESLVDSVAPGESLHTSQITIENTPFYLATVGGSHVSAEDLPNDVLRILTIRQA